MNLLLIEWVDSNSAPSGWRRLKDMASAAESLPCHSVGWLVAEKKGIDGFKLLAPHISGKDRKDLVPYGMGELCIPNGAIKKLTILQRTKK